MLSSKVRTSCTTQGGIALSAWTGNNTITDYLALNLGSNPNSKLEVVSLLNLLNSGHWQHHYNYENCPTRYYPKLYLGTFQSVALFWLYDIQYGQKNGLPNLVPETQKSGSWP